MTTEKQSSKEEREKMRQSSIKLSMQMLKHWMATFAAVFKTMPDEDGLRAYREVLTPYSAEQIERGCKHILIKQPPQKFMPKPGEIIEAINDTMPPAQPETGDWRLTDEEAKQVLKEIQEKREKMFGKGA